LFSFQDLKEALKKGKESKPADIPKQPEKPANPAEKPANPAETLSPIHLPQQQPIEPIAVATVSPVILGCQHKTS
jgi:hypothetical protein